MDAPIWDPSMFCAMRKSVKPVFYSPPDFRITRKPRNKTANKNTKKAAKKPAKKTARKTSPKQRVRILDSSDDFSDDEMAVLTPLRLPPPSSRPRKYERQIFTGKVVDNIDLTVPIKHTHRSIENYVKRVMLANRFRIKEYTREHLIAKCENRYGKGWKRLDIQQDWFRELVASSYHILQTHRNKKEDELKQFLGLLT
ncbi:unnamed protein product [Oikopleura dioica]|uniref:Uncharacterized protein n=1 Tax=Oikopleura dioica TaxID=34765 RepID=E4XCE5_OIKDI|nr:unnamed protein product [Oikopleura dioica]CBY39663.1 unnamed protein product [Oikopleura dioica]